MTLLRLGIRSLIFLLLVFPARAEENLESSPHSPSFFFIQATAGWVGLESLVHGFDLAGAFLVEPFTGRGFQIGPRIGFLAGKGRSGPKVEMNSGLEGTLWFANAIGPGLALDFIGPSKDDFYKNRGPDFRFESMLSARFKHYRTHGAWAIRGGVLYDTRHEWGMRLAVSLQFNGVPRIGELWAENTHF